MPLFSYKCCVLLKLVDIYDFILQLSLRSKIYIYVIRCILGYAYSIILSFFNWKRGKIYNKLSKSVAMNSVDGISTEELICWCFDGSIGKK